MDQPSLLKRTANKQADLKRDYRLYQLTRQITNNTQPNADNPAVAFFAASTRISGISLNAAFAYLAACGLQVAEIPVVYFACQAGMSRCVWAHRLTIYLNHRPARLVYPNPGDYLHMLRL